MLDSILLSTFIVIPENIYHLVQVYHSKFKPFLHVYGIIEWIGKPCIYMLGSILTLSYLCGLNVLFYLIIYSPELDSAR